MYLKKDLYKYTYYPMQQGYTVPVNLDSAHTIYATLIFLLSSMVSDDTYANLDESIKYDEPKFKVFYQKGRATVSPASISQHQKNQLTTAECYSNVPNQLFLVLNERTNE